jgi:PAS domain S-box-containing protein
VEPKGAARFRSCHPDLVGTGVNAGAEKVNGYQAEEIIGHNFSFFFPPEEIK